VPTYLRSAQEIDALEDWPRLQALRCMLNVDIVPLLLTFAAILVISIIEVLR
jgi:hypothetical protein